MLAFVLVGLVVGVELLYVVAANAFLAFGLVPRVFVGLESVEADIASGWTVIPGVIHVRGLRVTIQDRNVEAAVEMDRADVVLSLHELPSRMFHATKVRGSGLVFRFRHRVDPSSEGLPRVRALPPIRGFEDPPVYEASVPEPPIPDARYDLWTVHLEDVDVHGDDLWVEQFRYLGRARAVGAFALTPARRLWVGPASLLFEPGRVVAAGHDAFTAFSGSIECTVDPFDVRVPDGFAVLRYISAKTELRGHVAGGEFVDLFVPPRWKAHVQPKGAKFVVHTVLERGVLAPTSRISLEGDSLAMQVDQLSLNATGPWSVSGTGAVGGRVVATFSRALLTRPGQTGPPITVRDVTAGASSASLDTTVPWALRGADVSVSELVAPDLRILDDQRLGGVRLRGGAGVLRGHAAYSGDTLSGAGTVELRDAVVDVSETEIRGSATLDATAHSFDVRGDTGSFDLSLHGNAIRVADASGDATCPWGQFEKADAEAHLSLLSRGRSSGKLDASIDGAKVRWGDVRISGNTDVRAKIQPAAEEGGDDSRATASLRAFQLRVRTGAGPPKRWSADVPATILDASLALRGGMLDGPIEVTAKRAHVSIGEVSMRTDVRARLRVKPLDVEQRSGTVSGVVDVTNTSLWRGDRRIGGWWAKVGLSPTRVVAAQDLELDGRVSAKFRDGLPGLLALSESGEIPGFLPDLLPLHELAGTLDVRRHCRLMDLRFSRVEGGPLIASGRVQNVPGKTRGAVLVRLSGFEIVSMGVSLGEHGSGVSLFAGDQWLEEQTVSLRRAAAWSVAHACAPPRKTVCQ